MFLDLLLSMTHLWLLETGPLKNGLLLRLLLGDSVLVAKSRRFQKAVPATRPRIATISANSIEGTSVLRGGRGGKLEDVEEDGGVEEVREADGCLLGLWGLGSKKVLRRSFQMEDKLLESGAAGSELPVVWFCG